MTRLSASRRTLCAWCGVPLPDSIPQHPVRYAASLAAVLTVAGSVLAAGSPAAAHATADLRASTTATTTTAGPGLSTTAGGSGTTAGGSGITPRLKTGTPAPPKACFVGPCGSPALQPSWQNDFNDELGTITVRGKGFTPGDTVTITIDAGYTTQSLTTKASPNQWIDLAPIAGGSFSVSVPGIGCGGNPWDGEETTVSAQDEHGRGTSDAIPTPCAG